MSLLLVLSDAQIEQVMSVAEAISTQRAAFVELQEGGALVPERIIMSAPLGPTLFKPALSSVALGVKVVSVRAVHGVQGAILLLDNDSGRALSLLNANYLTAIRTAAGSAVSIDILAPAEIHQLCIFGAGQQARLHIVCAYEVRKFTSCVVVNRSAGRAEKLCASLRKRMPLVEFSVLTFDQIELVDEQVAQSQLIITATASSVPVLRGKAISPGSHVCCVGAFRADQQEVDEETIRRSYVVADSPDEVWHTTGDFQVPHIERAWIRESLGQLICRVDAGEAPLVEGPQRITLFKSIGNAIQDVTIAACAYNAAIRANVGTKVENF